MLLLLGLGVGLVGGGLGLACLSAIAWASLDGFRKHLSASIAPVPLLVLLNVFLLPLFGGWWWVVGGAVNDFGAYALPAGIELALQITANLLFLAALRASPLSMTVPFLALTPVFAAAVAALSLGERPGATQLLGLALVVAGALSLGAERGPSPTPATRAEQPHPPRRRGLMRLLFRERGARMMVGVAACWGTTAALDKAALLHAPVPLHALVQLGGVTLAGLGYLVVSRRLKELAIGRSSFAFVGAAALSGALAFGTQLVAVQLVLVSVLETIKRAFGLVSAVVVGRLVFHEPITQRKLIAIALMTAGVILLALQ